MCENRFSASCLIFSAAAVTHFSSRDHLNFVEDELNCRSG